MAGKIVVGVDGSEHAQRALRYALDTARARGTAVEAVYVYAQPPSWHALDPEIERDIPDELVLQEREAASLRLAEEHARADLERTLADADTGDVELRILVVNARQPAEALLSASRDADLLVVGSRGRGGFAGLLLGSVSQHCVQHASCPVMVIH